MASRHMADLVAEHADQLCFVVEVWKDAARDVNVAAGKRERIDSRRIQHRKAPRQIRPLRSLRELHAQVLHVPLQVVIL